MNFSYNNNLSCLDEMLEIKAAPFIVYFNGLDRILEIKYLLGEIHGFWYTTFTMPNFFLSWN